MISTSQALRESVRRERRIERRRFLHQRVAALHSEGLQTAVIARRLQASADSVLNAMHAMGLTSNWGTT